MEDSKKVMALTQAMHVMSERHAALARVPSLQDLMRLLRRTGASEATCELAQAAWSLLEDERDARALYLALCVIADAEVSAQAGTLPEDASVRISDAVRRVAPRMHTPEGLADATLHEELLRSMATQLGLQIEDEREATSSYLYANSDAVLAQMASKKVDYDIALQRAKQAIDTKHRPARPNGE